VGSDYYAVKLSRRVARFNKLINNPVQGTYAWLVPPWAILVHRGRRSGRWYRTPVLAFRQGGKLIVALLYGEESDWLANLRAGQGFVVRAGRTFPLRAVRVVSGEGKLSGLSSLTRAYCRLADSQVVLELGERQPGFGPRRRAA
jgi:deazaflavin-dependent oxidoreductase (nitroreductase family)